MSKRTLKVRSLWLLAGVVVLFSSVTLTPTSACTICVGFPSRTTADALIEGENVMLAREDDQHPFSFAPVELLKGRFDGEPIDLLVDSVTRRRLAVDRSHHVLLIQDTADASWRSLGVINSDFEAVVRRIVVFASDWQGEAGHRRRTEFFVSLFGHEDPSIYQLAYLELGRAPYRVIRRLGERIEREQIAPILDRHQYLQWRSLAILLLAQNREPSIRQKIVNRFHTAERLGLTMNLAAWATAAIEIEQDKAIRFIVREYFSDAARSQEELREIVKALSVHGLEGHLHLRGEIAAAYQVLVEVHPELADAVQNDVTKWNRANLGRVSSRITLDTTNATPEGQATIERSVESRQVSPREDPVP